MRFSDISGHREEIARLISMVKSGRLPHALLLHGQSGLGKHMVARALAQYIFCSHRTDHDSCGKCPSCLQTSKFNNPDIHYVFPVLKKSSPARDISDHYLKEWKEMLHKYPYLPEEKWLEILDAGNSRPLIYVSESEELIRAGALSSYADGYKVFIIWQPEKMNPEASNKLLKLIEEPFEDTLFIFVSNNADAIMPTIRSRLQEVEFKPLSRDEIKEIMIRKGKNVDEACHIARLAKGNMGKALAILDSESETAEFTGYFVEVMRAAYARKMTELKGFAEKFYQMGREKSLRILIYFNRMIRESFISNLQCEQLEFMAPAEKNFVARFGPFINEANVEEMMKETDSAYEDISRNANQRIVWFDLFIQYARLIRTKGVANARSGN